jgi:prolyl-tRNA synthetase
MPTLWSKTLIPTARQVPAEAQVPSHVLMLRAGLIRQLGAGLYSYLPLGLRALRKAMAIVREEMDAAGAVEVFLPTLQPIELWEQTGRRTDYGENLFVVTDRHKRELALGPTHEEVTTDLLKAFAESYKDLPITLYQIQTKFRDEYRPRFGVLRSREFQMKDAYSFDLTVEGLDKSYQAMYDAYCRIFSRCGLPYEIVEAESGPIGGSASHEFMVPSPTGEDVILKSDKGNYAANVEKCEIGDRPHDLDGQPTGELEKLHTPGCASIEDVCAFFKKNLGSKLAAKNMLKTLVCDSEQGVLIAIVRGDHDLNLVKLKKAVGSPVELAPDDVVRQGHFAIGFVGPHVAVDRQDLKLVVDPDAARGGFWVSGANETDYHVKHFNWKRDVLDHVDASRIVVADIRNAVAADPSPRNDGGVLQETKGIEVGHVFKLGTKYSDALDFKVVDERNERRPVIMGCYGIGVNRILAGAIERPEGHDDNGIIWPAAIAPYTVIITPIKYQGDQQDAADRIAGELENMPPAPGGSRGLIDVLIDDRDERPGVKFKDADLIGIPLRITIGEKALAEGKVEIKPRTAAKPELVPLDQAAARAAELLASL